MKERCINQANEEEFHVQLKRSFINSLLSIALLHQQLSTPIINTCARAEIHEEELLRELGAFLILSQTTSTRKTNEHTRLNIRYW